MLIGTPPSSASMSKSALYLWIRSQARSSSLHLPFGRLAFDERAEALRHFFVGDPLETVHGDGRDGGIDPTDGVGATGGRVLLGCLVEPLHGQLDGGGPVHALGPAQ